MNLNLNLNGGALISQGAYGCIYYPEKTCKGNDKSDKKYVSKLQKDNHTLRNEVHIGKIVKRIPSYEKYFSIIEDVQCKQINFENIDKNNDCNVLKKQSHSHHSSFALTKSLYVSKNTLSSYITNKNDFGIMLEKLIHIFSKILVSLEKLQDKTIIHLDLHHENIMIRNNKPIIIDFGISFTYNELSRYTTHEQIKQIFFVYAPDFFSIPPEFHYISYLVDMKNNSSQKRDPSYTVFQDIKNKQSFFRLLLTSNEIEAYYRELERVLKQLGRDPVKIIREISWKTWDVYMICINWLRFLRFMRDSSTMMQDNVVFKPFLSLLKQGIHPNPLKRISLSTLKEKIKLFTEHVLKNKGLRNTYMGKYTRVQLKRLKDENTFLATRIQKYNSL